MTAPTYDLGSLHGGLRLDANKQSATASGLATMPVPDQIVLPLAQHAGDPADPMVGIGERVLKGQMIAAGAGALSAPVHASTSRSSPGPSRAATGNPGPASSSRATAKTAVSPAPGTRSTTTHWSGKS